MPLQRSEGVLQRRTPPMRHEGLHGPIIAEHRQGGLRRRCVWFDPTLHGVVHVWLVRQGYPARGLVGDVLVPAPLDVSQPHATEPRWRGPDHREHSSNAGRLQADVWVLLERKHHPEFAVLHASGSAKFVAPLARARQKGAHRLCHPWDEGFGVRGTRDRHADARIHWTRSQGSRIWTGGRLVDAQGERSQIEEENATHGYDVVMHGELRGGRWHIHPGDRLEPVRLVHGRTDAGPTLPIPLVNMSNDDQRRNQRRYDVLRGLVFRPKAHDRLQVRRKIIQALQEVHGAKTPRFRQHVVQRSQRGPMAALEADCRNHASGNVPWE
mmetsp:Transcript_49344/g.138189  ORF Transcript_49344/g.138189 Transcript_49344/m.138189 type:complete len:325 (-) Transcript_49344:713-1687(-)